MNKLEQVARAICEANGEAGKWWKNYERQARAAIEALMEPTEAMLYGCDKIPDHNYGRIMMTKKNLRAIYQAMLRVALDGKE